MPTIQYIGGGRYRHGGTTFEPGDIVSVGADRAAYLVDDVGAFERVGDGGGDGSGETAADPPFDPGAQSVAEFSAALDAGDYTDAELDALAAAEAAGDDRVTAHDAIDAAREA